MSSELRALSALGRFRVNRATLPDSDRVERTREVMLGVEVEKDRRRRDIRGKGEGGDGGGSGEEGGRASLARWIEREFR